MNENNETKEELSTPSEGVDIKRRSFSKAGMAAPILLSFASRPAWSEQGLANCSFNQALSGNISPGANLACGSIVPSSISPDGLKELISSSSSLYPTIVDNLGVSFNDLFVTDLNLNPPTVIIMPPPPPRLDNPTLGEIVLAADTQLTYDPSVESASLARHFATAYLLAISSEFVYPCSAADIVAGWQGNQPLFDFLLSIQSGPGDDILTVADVNFIINPV